MFKTVEFDDLSIDPDDVIKLHRNPLEYDGPCPNNWRGIKINFNSYDALDELEENIHTTCEHRFKVIKIFKKTFNSVGGVFLVLFESEDDLIAFKLSVNIS